MSPARRATRRRAMLSEIHVSGLTGRVALVTGAAGGIGRAITTTLLAQGARVAAADLEPPSVDGAMAVTMDVSDEAAVNAAFNVVERELGGVQVVVLNAGV